MTPNMERGARIIIHEWVKVRAWDKVLIVTSKEYLAEAKAMEKEASGKARSVNTLLVENKGRHVGIFFDDNEAVFDPYTAIIAATEYSLVTTKAAKRAIQRHKKFLSLPLATNDGRSFLEYDFLTMDTKKSRLMAKAYAPFVRKIEVEVENLDMVREAVDAGADIIMLDNMSPEDMKEAIRIIDGRAETECSGNVTKENIDRLTSLGVDYISSGALTHSAPVLDISLKNLHAI